MLDFTAIKQAINIKIKNLKIKLYNSYIIVICSAVNTLTITHNSNYLFA